MENNITPGGQAEPNIKACRLYLQNRLNEIITEQESMFFVCEFYVDRKTIEAYNQCQVEKEKIIRQLLKELEKK